MTTAQSISASPSRRALLVGALGGIGALAAGVIGRASPVRAADGATVHVGDELVGTSVTKITNSDNSAAVIQGASTNGTGLYGTSSSGKGVYGVSTSNFGIHGASTSYIAVYGDSGSREGVYGSSTSIEAAALVGRSLGNTTGVLGSSGVGAIPIAMPLTGVFGYGGQDLGCGVWGESPDGRAIQGTSNGGWAGYFNGRVYTRRYHEMKEISAPSAPGVDRARIFLRDNGSGKTQLCVRFNSGAIQVLATQP